jgi:hypothetical protein
MIASQVGQPAACTHAAGAGRAPAHHERGARSARHRRWQAMATLLCTAAGFGLLMGPNAGYHPIAPLLLHAAALYTCGPRRMISTACAAVDTSAALTHPAANDVTGVDTPQMGPARSAGPSSGIRAQQLLLAPASNALYLAVTGQHVVGWPRLGLSAVACCTGQPTRMVCSSD